MISRFSSRAALASRLTGVLVELNLTLGWSSLYSLQISWMTSFTLENLFTFNWNRKILYDSLCVKYWIAGSVLRHGHKSWGRAVPPPPPTISYRWCLNYLLFVSSVAWDRNPPYLTVADYALFYSVWCVILQFIKLSLLKTLLSSLICTFNQSSPERVMSSSQFIDVFVNQAADL